jgi:hypothetical protein
MRIYQAMSALLYIIEIISIILFVIITIRATYILGAKSAGRDCLRVCESLIYLS